MSMFLVPKSSETYFCDKCHYITSRNSQYQRHLLTAKHKNQQLATNLVPKGSTGFTCNCGKEFKDRSGLWRHSKKCQINEIVEKDEPITKELVMQLIKQNQNLQDMLHEQHNKMFELAKEGKYITNNTTNNKTFNLQVYLNETCKDAINLTDFVDSIKVQIKDLEKVGEKGYAEGISEIFINNLQQLKTHSRPIHCSDSKRETLYIKDENQWSKDDEQKSTLTKAIKHVANENIRQIGEWKKEHPNCTDSDSKKNTLYLNIVSNAMSGVTCEEQAKNYEKIISNIAKEVVIEK